MGFSEDGSRIVFETYTTHDLSFWDAYTGNFVETKSPSDRSPFNGDCNDPQISGDGTKILSSKESIDTVLRTGTFIPQLWDANTGKLIRSFPEAASKITPRLSPDGTLLATSINLDTILLWDVATGNIIKKTPDLKNLKDLPYIYSSWDCSKYLVGSYKQSCNLFNVSNDSVIASYSDFNYASQDLSSIACSDGYELNFINQKKTKLFDTVNVSYIRFFKSFDNSKYLISVEMKDQGTHLYLHVNDRNIPVSSTDYDSWSYLRSNPFSMDGSRILVVYDKSVPCLYDISGISKADRNVGKFRSLIRISQASITGRSLRFSIPPIRGTLELRIYNLSGRLAAMYTKPTFNQTTQLFSLPYRMEKGIYLYRINMDGLSSRGKFILAR